MSSNATAERLKHVQELRKAHFHFGFDEDTNHQSVAKQPMPMQKTAKVRPMTSVVEKDQKLEQQQPQQPIQAPKLQQNHFHLGDDKPKLESIQKSDFQRPQSAAIAKLSDETKKDLRSHHFQLGYHDTNKPTEYEQNFGNQGKNNFKKADNADLRQTSSRLWGYKQLLLVDALLGQGYSKERMAEMNVQLRKTHLVMGRDDNGYTTQNQAIYGKPQVQVNNFQDKTQQLVRNTHITMGTDRVEYTSQAKASHVGNQGDRSILNEAQLKDLRATHFQVGNEQAVNYQSAYRSQFSDRKGQQEQVRNPQLQSNHFDLKDEVVRPTVQEHYKSTYNQQFDGQKAEKVNPIVDNSKNIMIGNDKLSYQSEAQARFRDFHSKPGKLQEEVQAELRKHHFKFGTDEDTTESVAKAQFKNPHGQPSKMDAEMKKDLRTHHFQLGYCRNDYQTHQKEFGSKQGPPNKLPPEMAQRVRQSSYQN
ncbi:unnamed protein product (macronuclear) [Paramecium tetraurelia]|uniref:Uncharacterized protein n=1 Tax=Paramecium tetraurelia TaxID=5888 RepID=A0EFY6_PARTE|nr:uncharacterized protein GSPATT00026550001 [Paramecium tetraurelia]CAK94227.1 unnamed protein product [Paramecium tetraurelia]|eukprot:XP_001461600.1 hypothetical protein (macronuclear) [Paramecium tetraurelia strain d4-2]